jgi:polyisoprenoid-binding protein YceI
MVKKVVLLVVGLALLVVAGSFAYVTWFNKADKPLSQTDVNNRLDSTTTAAGSAAPGATTAPGSTGANPTNVDGTWKIGAGSEVGYRVSETINGFDAVANGRTTKIDGSVTIAGTTAQKAEFTVDMTSFTSDQSRRDAQFNGRIMQVDQFPTATFTLTSPIDFGAIPAAGKTIDVKGSGDLTLHGVTRPVTFPLSATFKNGRIGILGKIPVTFADYGVVNPSFATVTTEDHGQLEFVLILDHG